MMAMLPDPKIHAVASFVSGKIQMTQTEAQVLTEVRVQALALEPLAQVRDPLKAELLTLVRAQLEAGRENRDPLVELLDGHDLLLGTPTLRLMFLITWTLAFVPEL